MSNSVRPGGSSGSFVCVRAIPVHPGGRRFRSCAFAPFKCTPGSSGSFGCVQFIPVRPGDRRVLSIHTRLPWGSSGAFGPFPSALEVVGFVRVRLYALGFVRVRFSVHSRALWWSLCYLGFVLPILVRHRVPSRAFGPLPCALRSSDTFRCIPVSRRVRSSALGTFPYALEIVVVVPVRSIYFRAPWGTYGSSFMLAITNLDTYHVIIAVAMCILLLVKCENNRGLAKQKTRC